MATRRWGPWVLVVCAAAAACSLTVGKADLDSVACTEDKAIGPPACDYGQLCLDGRCQKCAAVDLCGDGIDNDCTNGPDDGCAGSGGDGGASQGGTGHGGQGGKDASVDQSAGGSAGQGGAAGAAGSAGGQGGASGGAGANGGSAGTAGEPPPDVIETGPVLAKAGQPCDQNTPCEPDLFCGPTGSPAAGKCTRGCCTSADCTMAPAPDTVCVPGYGGGVCVPAPGPIGANEPGQYCGEAKECRSGRCDGNRCQDTCCAQGDCKNEHDCSLVDVNNLLSWKCTFWPSAHGYPAGTPCDSDSDCISNVCDTLCVSPCCGDCSLTGCAYWASGGSAYRSCGGTFNYVEACCRNSDCGDGRKCVAKSASSYYALQCE